MKKTLAIGLTAALIGISSIIPLTGGEHVYAEASAVGTASTVLSQGMSGSSVGSLQSNLKILGYFTYPNNTAYFGSITAQAVRDFQQAYSLPVTGSVDTATQTSISHALVKKQIVADASNYMRVPYVWGGATPDGFDCSGFISFMFNKFGVTFNRTSSSDMAVMGTSVARAGLQPGDWVFFALNDPGVISHVGIYIGNGEFISATRSMGIYIQKLDNSYWGPKYMGARRFY
ncbi:C40 family peptidase [Paenibacillus sp. UNC451MF]|uniref:C40 family peptidase n=1 Tax=Paenibacillus sp. UNC451MF TaxID=1449063 RepID=UPI00048DD540|nr:NlpC/P60 family protein [Paenibacillus sp. UNC451MF]